MSLLVLPDSEDYLCPIDEAVYIEAYERLASVQRCFYTQTFEEIALTYLNLLGIDATKYSPDNCVAMYKCLVALVEYIA